jgi:membrane protease YdiL (CAAX protease family)
MTKASRGITVYLLLSFGGAWALWLTAALMFDVSPQSPLFQLLLLPGGFAPAAATLVVRGCVTGEGFADVGLRPNLGHWRPYAFGLLWPLAGVLAVVGLAVLLGVSSPDPTLGRALSVLAPDEEAPPLPPFLWAVVPVQLLVFSVLIAPVLFGEEFGWRGYLQKRLFGGRPLPAAVGTGLIWGAWHYPLVLAGYQFPDDRLLGLAVFPVSCVLLSIVFGWLQERAGSVWAPSVAHAATNAVGGSLLTLLFLGGPNWIFVSYLGILGWVPAGVLCLWIVLTGRLRTGRPR